MRAVYKGLLQDAINSYSQLIAMYPEDPELYLERGNAHLALWHNKDAQSDFERAVGLAPDNAQAHDALASILVLHSRPIPDKERALVHANRSIELAPDQVEYHLKKLEVLRQLSRHRELHEEIDYIQGHYKESAKTLSTIAGNLYFAGLYADALPYAQRAIELDRDNRFGAWTYLGGTLGGLRRDDEAIVALTKSIELGARINHVYSRFPYEFRGIIYQRQKRYEAALADYDMHMELDPSPYHVYKRRAVCHFHLRNYDEALADLETAMRGRPEDTSTLTWISPADVANCPNEAFRQGMLALMTKWIESPHNRPDYHSARASLYLALGKPELAQADLRISLASPKASANAWYTAAMAALAAKDSNGYQQTAHEMTQLFQNSTDFNTMYWTFWTAVLAPGGVSRDAELLVLAKKAVTEKPMDSGALQILGALHFRLGDFTAAREQLQAAHEATPTGDIKSAPAYTWYFLAMTEHQLGNQDAAQEWLAKASEYRENALREEANSSSKIPWNRKLTLELLDTEARALLSPPEPAMKR